MNKYTFHFEEGIIIVREFCLQIAIIEAQSEARDKGWNDENFFIGIELGEHCND